MRITLAGQPFDLTPELVRRRLAGQQPKAIQEYWVDIDGVRWPVKQVVALAIGTNKGFQSQSAQRWLRNLGFVIGSGASPITGKQASASPRRDVRFDQTSLPELDAIDVRVAFTWLRAGTVVLHAEGLPRFPPLPRLPGLYRYDFGIDGAGVRRLYIGESGDLARRASNYRNAKVDRARQRTNRRMHKEIVSHLSAGGSIEFAITTSVRWGEDEELDLRLKSARRLAENAAVLTAQSQADVRVLNIDAELEEGAAQ